MILNGGRRVLPPSRGFKHGKLIVSASANVREFLSVRSAFRRFFSATIQKLFIYILQKRSQRSLKYSNNCEMDARASVHNQGPAVIVFNAIN